MSAQHTPAPWHVNSTEAHGEACAYAANIIGPESVGSPCLACMEFQGAIETDSEATKANAHLISAAPELFAALKLYDANFDAGIHGQKLPRNPIEVANIARAALAKAKGQP